MHSLLFAILKYIVDPRIKKLIITFVGLIIFLAGLMYLGPKLGGEPSPSILDGKRQHFRSQGREHINVGVSHPAYNSNPPASGWHYDQPARTGVYSQELPDEQIVHNLEHGHVWISYKPDLDQDSINKLIDIAKDYGTKIIITPRSKNDNQIALAAWEYLLTLDSVDEPLIHAFINAHRGKGPENVPDFNSMLNR